VANLESALMRRMPWSVRGWITVTGVKSRALDGTRAACLVGTARIGGHASERPAIADANMATNALPLCSNVAPHAKASGNVMEMKEGRCLPGGKWQNRTRGVLWLISACWRGAAVQLRRDGQAAVRTTQAPHGAGRMTRMTSAQWHPTALAAARPWCGPVDQQWIPPAILRIDDLMAVKTASWK